MNNIDMENQAKEMEEIFLDIAKERGYQDSVWGGENHDKHHSIDTWVAFMTPYLGNAVRGNNWKQDKAKTRTALIKVAALCVAALQSLDDMPDRR